MIYLYLDVHGLIFETSVWLLADCPMGWTRTMFPDPTPLSHHLTRYTKVTASSLNATILHHTRSCNTNEQHLHQLRLLWVKTSSMLIHYKHSPPLKCGQPCNQPTQSSWVNALIPIYQHKSGQIQNTFCIALIQHRWTNPTSDSINSKYSLHDHATCHVSETGNW
jgi:hypothetical protein